MTKPLNESPIGRDGIARVVHESVRAYKAALGEDALPLWDQAPQWQIDATRSAVDFRLNNPGAGAREQHEQWKENKLADGWRYGKVKNAEAKTHPLLITYEDLPASELLKDRLIQAVIDCFTHTAPSPRNAL